MKTAKKSSVLFPIASSEMVISHKKKLIVSISNLLVAKLALSWQDTRAAFASARNVFSFGQTELFVVIVIRSAAD